MITLKTLPQASLQEIFDQGATHLMTQMQKSSREGQCMYRDPHGLKCAIGCFIADSEYKPEMEGHTVADLPFISYTIEHRALCLLVQLQSVHDSYPESHWDEQLHNVADNFCLNDSVLGE